MVSPDCRSVSPAALLPPLLPVLAAAACPACPGPASSKTTTIANPEVHCRREERQEAREAAAFEAASQAKALVKAWNKPRLSASRTSLPAELWGLILEQVTELVTEDRLWDLRGTVQELCQVSLACKGLHSAVQLQCWPKLCSLLQPLRTPPSLQRHPAQKGQLPNSPDVLISDPAALRVPELKAACAYYGQTSSGDLPGLQHAWCQLGAGTRNACLTSCTGFVYLPERAHKQRRQV